MEQKQSLAMCGLLLCVPLAAQGRQSDERALLRSSVRSRASISCREDGAKRGAIRSAKGWQNCRGRDRPLSSPGAIVNPAMEGRPSGRSPAQAGERLGSPRATL